MPKAKKRPATVQPVIPPVTLALPSPTTNGNGSVPSPTGPHNLPVVYDRVEIAEYSSTSEHGPLTAETVKEMMGWETETEWRERMVRDKGGKPEHYLFGENGPKREDTGTHQPVHCVNTDKVKVVCWQNANNRPFDMLWCEDLIHTILYGQWAGPLMMPGETINGETVRISRYGRVLSGQHQGTALVLADEWLQKSRAVPGNAVNPKYPVWNGHEHVVLETVVITGLSEDERVLRTIDYVKPRTTADMLYTMELFRQNTSAERKEMTRMLALAIDLLWVRTDTKGYKTHPEVVGFLERHKRLLKCVEHLFVENSAKGADGGRKISKLRVSAGQASALCYLMGCGSQKTTEYSDEYRNESPPSEKNLDWEYWDRAQEFWVCLAGARDFMPVRRALGLLVESTPDSDANQGLGGRAPEKFAILAKAWERYKDHPTSAGSAFDDDDLAPDGVLCLSYSDLDDKGNKLPDGQIKLVDMADFYGIDCPESLGASKTKGSRQETPMLPPPSPEEIERATQEALRRRMAKAP